RIQMRRRGLAPGRRLKIMGNNGPLNIKRPDLFATAVQSPYAIRRRPVQRNIEPVELEALTDRAGSMTVAGRTCRVRFRYGKHMERGSLVNEALKPVAIIRR